MTVQLRPERIELWSQYRQLDPTDDINRAKLAQRLLDNTIQVCVFVDDMGNVELVPAYEIDRKLVSATNLHDGKSTVYAQTSQDIDALCERFPDMLYTWNDETMINDGCTIEVDTWTYLHTVGGQIG